MASTQQIHDLYDSVLILDFGSQVRSVLLSRYETPEFSI